MILLLKNEAGKKSVLPFLKNVFFIEAKEIGEERDNVYFHGSRLFSIDTG